MFTKAKNIETTFRQIRIFTMMVIIGCMLLCGFVLFKSYQTVSSLQDKIYILADGKVLEAFASGRNENIVVEARDHVITFHRYFFSLDPDDKAISENISKALYLADGSAKKQYDNLKEKSYYSNIISANISQTIKADSVNIEIGQYPFHFKFYGKQTITRASSVVERILVTEGYLRNVSRSDHNPHGLLIEKWRTLENRDLSVKNR
ncbi:conjugative transposon protein TraK [Aquiflexum sp.]|uniref:conjugative transposon protein TraK n=1 Tax=Aquiflexum sp. TaxID=1872584 RepID=UPI0035933294